uniref:Pyrin domain-containing protein n=1 Tax=Cyprinus carpio TaxID=7962 RepID=A0A8C1IMZ5_CYPCA
MAFFPSPQLLETLEDLESKKLKKFKWHLKHDSLASTADVEKADVFDTVDHMVARCGPEGAMEITLNILRKMNENHLAECLENKLKGNHTCKPNILQILYLSVKHLVD